MKKEIKPFFAVFLKILAILLAIIMLWLAFGSAADEYSTKVDNSSEIEEVIRELADFLNILKCSTALSP